MRGIRRGRLAPESPSEAAAGPPEQQLSDPGAVKNTLLQFASQIATALFTGVLTLYLVRKLGASQYGVYALAVSIGTILLFPAGLGLPWAVGRFLADHREDLGQVRAILLLGLKLQAPAALLTGLLLFAASGPIASAFGNPHLEWPLRWIALSVIGQAMFVFLMSVSASVRRSGVNLWMVIIESATETPASIVLVAVGAGAAGAALGKTIGYAVGATAGLYLTIRLVGGLRRNAVPAQIGFRALSRYAGAMFIVDLTWSAIGQLDLVLIGLLLTSADVGSFGAVLRVLTILGYVGLAVSGGVAPRVSLGGSGPDTKVFVAAIRFLILVQGLILAPMIVWAKPIVGLLLGPGYPHAAEILAVLSISIFVGGPAALITLAVTYLGEARRRVAIMLWTFGLGLISTYLLLQLVGLIGAAIADDVIQIVYVSAHLWLCSRMIEIDLRRLAICTFRTLLAAAAMALPLLSLGTDHLSVAAWILGPAFALIVYCSMLIGTEEVSPAELRLAVREVRARLVPHA